MTKAEMEAFLDRPLIARLATVRADGTPQLTPMWFSYENGAVYMSTRAHAAKVKHARTNPNVAVVVDVMEEPYKNRIVTIEGKAQVLTTKDTDVKAWTEKIRTKYVRKAAAKLRGQMDDERVILKITPRRVRTFDSTGS
jgi:PPOX class probable F420-dependent enzyme